MVHIEPLCLWYDIRASVEDVGPSVQLDLWRDSTSMQLAS